MEHFCFLQGLVLCPVFPCAGEPGRQPAAGMWAGRMQRAAAGWVTESGLSVAGTTPEHTPVAEIKKKKVEWELRPILALYSSCGYRGSLCVQVT